METARSRRPWTTPRPFSQLLFLTVSDFEVFAPLGLQFASLRGFPWQQVVSGAENNGVQGSVISETGGLSGRGGVG